MLMVNQHTAIFDDLTTCFLFDSWHMYFLAHHIEVGVNFILIFYALRTQILLCQIYHIHFQHLLLRNYSVDGVVDQRFYFSVFRAGMVPIFPVSATVVTKLISTNTCHVHATLFFFNHKQTFSTSPKIVIMFHELHNVLLTVFVSWVVLTQAFGAVFDEAFSTK